MCARTQSQVVNAMKDPAARGTFMRHLYLCVDGGIGGLAVICYKQLAFILLRNSKFVTAGQYLYACLLHFWQSSHYLPFT